MLPGYIVKAHCAACERKSLHKCVAIHLYPCSDVVCTALLHYYFRLSTDSHTAFMAAPLNQIYYSVAHTLFCTDFSNFSGIPLILRMR